MKSLKDQRENSGLNRSRSEADFEKMTIFEYLKMDSFFEIYLKMFDNEMLY